MNNLKHVWFIALKNLRLFLTDRMATGMFILFPFLFIVMFNLLLGNVGRQDNRLVLHLATQETSGISQQIIQGMATPDPSQLKPGEPQIVWDKDCSQAKADVESGKIDGLLVFPANFTQGVEGGNKTNLEIIAKPESTDTRMALNGLAQGIVSRIEAQRVEINAAISLVVQQGIASGTPVGIQPSIERILADLGTGTDTPSLIAYQADKVGEVKPMNPSSYVVPGYLVMFVFFAAAISAVEVIRERRTHTLERLLTSSVRKESILGGIYLGSVLKGLVQVAIFWAIGILVFRIDIGVAPWAVLVITFLMVLMSAAFSLMLATIVKTERSASAIAVVASLLLAPLGGCWWPLFITPHWMQFLAKFTPHGWATTGFGKLLVFGAGGGDVVWEMLALAGFAASFIIVAVINFRTGADAV